MNSRTLKLVNILGVISRGLFAVYCLFEVGLLIIAIASKINPDIYGKIGDFDALRFFAEQIFVIAILFCLIKIFDIIKVNQRFFVHPINLWIRGVAATVFAEATLKNSLYNFLVGVFNSSVKLTFVIKINFTSLIIGVALLILSFAIEHGIRLQKRDDETL